LFVIYAALLARILSGSSRSRNVRKGISLSPGNVSRRQQLLQQMALDTQYDVLLILIFVLRTGADFIAALAAESIAS